MFVTKEEIKSEIHDIVVDERNNDILHCSLSS